MIRWSSAPVVSAVVALVLAPMTLATVSAPRWAPSKMVDALFTLNYPSPKGAAVGEAACLGLGARTAAGYAGFRCQVGWLTMKAPLHSKQVTIWARPLPGGNVCAGTHGLASCKVVGTFAGVLCAPSPWNPRSQVAHCMYAATLRTLFVKLLPILKSPPTALEFSRCSKRGPTGASSDPSLLDCGFKTYEKQGDGAVLTWSGHAVVRYLRRGLGYEITRATVTHVHCLHSATGAPC